MPLAPTRIAAGCLASALLITACAQISDQTYIPRGDDPTGACVANLSGDPEFAALGTKIPLFNAYSATPAMLADASKPSAAERGVIELWVARRDGCYERGRAWRANNLGPQFVALSEQGQSSFGALAAELYTGRITYGEFSTRRIALAQGNDQAWEAATNAMPKGPGGLFSCSGESGITSCGFR
jgi:hypothetical protein